MSLSNVIAVVCDFVVEASSSLGGSLDVESICRPHPFATGPLVFASSCRVLFTLGDVIPMASVISFRNSSGYEGKIISFHLPLREVLKTKRGTHQRGFVSTLFFFGVLAAWAVEVKMCANTVPTKVMFPHCLAITN